MKLLFVGERRSALAVRMDVTWKDGRLAAKQLFDALVVNSIDPARVEFVNLFERGGPTTIARRRAEGYVIVGMGAKVQTRLAARGVPHLSLIHPAARGAIRKKERYANHLGEVLAETLKGQR